MSELDASSFERELRELLGTLKSGVNEGCVECVDCSACIRSTFCRTGQQLVGCHYCVRCKHCTDCSHCHDSTRLVGCHHCVASDDCTASRYVVRSTGLSNCVYCFGCVGLNGREFHILNRPYSRKEYFELTARLSRDLRLTR
jgi:hypothetical protein